MSLACWCIGIGILVLVYWYSNVTSLLAGILVRLGDSGGHSKSWCSYGWGSWWWWGLYWYLVALWPLVNHDRQWTWCWGDWFSLDWQDFEVLTCWGVFLFWLTWYWVLCGLGLRWVFEVWVFAVNGCLSCWVFYGLVGLWGWGGLRWWRQVMERKPSWGEGEQRSEIGPSRNVPPFSTSIALDPFHILNKIWSKIWNGKLIADLQRIVWQIFSKYLDNACRTAEIHFSQPQKQSPSFAC